MAAADSDLTTPATVALELGVLAGDARLPRLISVASDAIASFLNRRLHYAAAITEKTPGYGRNRLILDLTPIISIASVTLADGTLVTDFTHSAADDKAGFLYRTGGWPYTGAARPGLPPQNDKVSGSEAATITVVYAGGWITPAQEASVGWVGPVRSLPNDIEEACIQTVASLYRGNARDQAISSEGMGDYSVKYRDLTMAGLLPDNVVAQLAKYARPLG